MSKRPNRFSQNFGFCKRQLGMVTYAIAFRVRTSSKGIIEGGQSTPNSQNNKKKCAFDKGKIKDYVNCS